MTSQLLAPSRSVICGLGEPNSPGHEPGQSGVFLMFKLGNCAQGRCSKETGNKKFKYRTIGNLDLLLVQQIISAKYIDDTQLNHPRWPGLAEQRCFGSTGDQGHVG